MKNLVLYYSQTGSNRYLAERLAGALHCDIEAIRPVWDVPFLMMTGLHLGNKKLRSRLADYDRIILCGPIWVGQFIAPLRSFVNKYRDEIRQLVFVTSCGSSDEKKDEKFGYGPVFRQVGQLLGDKCIRCEAFPIPLALPADKRTDSESVMKTRLNDGNFKGEIAERFEALAGALKG
ncbi:MAG TPA: flavodoxin domain-containing protein [Saprospiraceae bacterium]|nr:flavodoxin domain-containing protein [Saprospiraceae bacterium]